MNKKYKVSVIGAGDRGNAYMRMLDTYYQGQIEFAGICDIRQDRMEKAFSKFGFTIQGDNFRQVIEESKPDIVVIATPAYFHCDIAAFAMENGCHVLTEKPFDIDMKKCFMLRDIQQKTGKAMAIGFQYKNMPRYRAMKKAVDDAVLGKNLVINFSDIRETRPKVAMHDAQYGNGGPFVDMACHLNDLMRWFYGCDPVKVTALWRRNAIDRSSLVSIEQKAPDSGVYIVEYENGGIGNVVLNWGLPTKVNSKFKGMAMGSEGLVEDMHEGDEIKVKIANDNTIIVNDPLKAGEEEIKPEKYVFDHLISEIEGKGKSQSSFDEGIMSLAVSMAAIRSSVIGAPVFVKDILDEKPTVFQCMSAK